ncbi:hypothetical protein FRX31_020388 [Thalictrum thalictroides]|uniref:Reverse transcriptase zinc-binding domain-containing protein n=1 Tax=Thalictrum thalictroides TaxID=46969 RepID=A0A7J6VY27_THATH|nr:hypothetical protein FRX31_020388 [Thalictrum thalictroides]
MLKVKFFIWCMLHGKVQTRDKLIQKGILITSICPMCNQVNETMLHLFFHCVWAQELWGDVLYTLGREAPNPTRCVSVEKWLLEWPQLHFSDFGKAVWKVVPYAVIWSIWRARNDKLFRNIDKGSERVRMTILGFI